MPEPTKELYDFSSIEELKKLAEESLEKLNKRNSADHWLHAIERLFNAGRDSLTKGDQEKAYILFMRCLNCYARVKNNEEFKQMDMTYFKAMYGSYINDAVRNMEKLDIILREKYEQKKLLENSEKINNKTKELDNDSNNFLTDTNKGPKSSSPQCDGVSQIISTEDKVYITSTELYDIAVENKSGPSTLILDIRLKEDFQKSRMKICDVINIPEERVVPGTTAVKLEQFLENDYKPYFKKRSEYDRVIIVDWSSTKEKAIPGSKIYIMLTILKKWDPRIKYKHTPVMLDGGFEDWLSRYPSLTTNHIVSPPKEPRNDQLFFLEKINYPTTLFELEKIEIKPATSSENNLKPTVDRSTKPGFQEKKTENVSKSNEKGGENINKKLASLDITENNNVTKIIVKNETLEQKKDEAIAKEKIENSENDDEDEMKQEYNRSNRRGALTTNVNEPSSLPKKLDVSVDDDDNDVSRNYMNGGANDENKLEDTQMTNNNHSEYNSKMKRYSSTPNISKLGSADYNKPVIDRSTKPSNDDQLNYYTMGSAYNNEIGKGLTGLKNIGNTCYMNSIIQCLSNTERLRKKLCSLDARTINEKSKTRGTIAREIIYIIKQLWNGDSGSVSCRSLKNIAGQYNDMFSGHEQQDSHEFLTILIDWLHEDLNDPPLIRNLDGADENSGEKAWGEFICKNNSIIRQLFYGQLKSTVSCSVCKKQSITFEPFSSLSLPLPPDEIESCTLSECLKLYISSDDVDKWQCSDCKTFRRATKKLDITKLPPLLVIHFKRFMSVGGCKKQKTYVDFPELLDMRPYIIGREHRNSRYQLYAVSNHSGSMESGHYTAYCKNSADRKWYEFDDQNVYRMPSVTKTKEAYIVFYQSIPD